MKLAKSLSLEGELLEASEASEYEAKFLNMVCSCCGATVIHRKEHTRNRGEKSIKVSATWAHRVLKSKEQQEFCEFRSNSISKEEVDKSKAIARKQYFKLIENNCLAIFMRFPDLQKNKPLLRKKDTAWYKYIRTVANIHRHNFFSKSYQIYSQHYEEISSFANSFWTEKVPDLITTFKEDKNESDADYLTYCLQQDTVYNTKLSKEILNFFAHEENYRLFCLATAASGLIPLQTVYISKGGDPDYFCEYVDKALLTQVELPKLFVAKLMGNIFTINWAAALAWAKNDAKAKSVKGFG